MKGLPYEVKTLIQKALKPACAPPTGGAQAGKLPGFKVAAPAVSKSAASACPPGFVAGRFRKDQFERWVTRQGRRKPERS
ncbi:MAG: hypothetical protein HYW10_02510 [Candidatus Omnitrophica bacterium]|nr:hypothetical protein [Candidatus Omnitrophota bacterium]